MGLLNVEIPEDKALRIKKFSWVDLAGVVHNEPLHTAGPVTVTTNGDVQAAKYYPEDGSAIIWPSDDGTLGGTGQAIFLAGTSVSMTFACTLGSASIADATVDPADVEIIDRPPLPEPDPVQPPA